MFMKTVTFSDSFVSFLINSMVNNKVSKALYKYYANIESIPAYSSMVTSSEIDYITFRNDGTISYLPKGKEHVVNEDGTWKKDNRQNGKPGKVIRKLFTAKGLKLFKDQDFEVFGNSYKAHFAEGFRMVLEPNEKIGKIYTMRYSDGEHTLNSSCMRNEDLETFDIYKYCAHVRILAMYDKDDNLAGRALVWNCENKTTNEYITFMDRVYTSKPYLEESFFEYAREQKWFRKAYQNFSDKGDLMSPEGVKLDQQRLRVYCDTSHSRYPYIDTFSYGDDDELNNYSGVYTYDNTDGTRSGDDNDDYEEEDTSVWDCIDECSIEEDDARQIERGQYRGQYTHVDNTTEVGNYTYWSQDPSIVYVSNDDCYYHQDDVTYCEHNEEYYHSSDCVYSEVDQCDYLKSDCTITENGWVLDNDVVTVDGLSYHVEHAPEPEEEEETEEEDTEESYTLSEDQNKAILALAS